VNLRFYTIDKGTTTRGIESMDAIILAARFGSCLRS